jgi:hypothetical protein
MQSSINAYLEAGIECLRSARYPSNGRSVDSRFEEYKSDPQITQKDKKKSEPGSKLTN